MADTVADYTQVEFPHETAFMDGGVVRLLATMSGKVIGISYYKYGDDEDLGQALVWNADGTFGDGSHSTMDLIPPPAFADQKLSKLACEISEARARLDANPGAPAEWRAVDERRIAIAEQQVAQLTVRMAA
jgi:hypothetical protein